MNTRQKVVLCCGLAAFVVAGLLVVPYSYAPGGRTVAAAVGTLWDPPVYPPEVKPTSGDEMGFADISRPPVYRDPMTIRILPYIAQLLVVSAVTGGLVLVLKD